jgi:NTE family protein
MDCPFDRTLALAETPTRLKRMDDKLQERLINWGYAVCDAALRKHVDGKIAKGKFPYPGAGV